MLLPLIPGLLACLSFGSDHCRKLRTVSYCPAVLSGKKFLHNVRPCACACDRDQPQNSLGQLLRATSRHGARQPDAVTASNVKTKKESFYNCSNCQRQNRENLHFSIGRQKDRKSGVQRNGRRTMIRNGSQRQVYVSSHVHLLKITESDNRRKRG